MSSSASLGIPQQDHSSGHRPASAAVSAGPPPSQSSSRRQQRGVSHQVVSQPQSHHSHQSSSHDQMPYPDVYSHPAAQAYAAAHPRRTIPKFGPYLLLQTLGEGEFGKVKLGLHCQWGEEVAVKLIRRGNIDSSVRMSKVEREIEVLRTLKHPNIVRLYDVIETDKYIGIILEYASGGELFDHILAHRYLKERDAAKLFSQLISGVWYIHQKKIVHRDLKLENLLLDRNRNVIITDFGFANRFEHRSDDLMQTSCGSPCYAAPELVISEGLYVGSAVDIWSCGVILYAMLAGYLPFDDDPQNPDGDNINLLYKYIVSTELQFPDYIGEEARSLLRMMLVPDPTKRSNLEEVMRHPWLAPYSTPKDGPPAVSVPNAFGRSVEQLERNAMEQHQQKRLAYQRQMKAAAMSAAGPQPPVNRTQSQYATTSASSRHQLAATDGGGRSNSSQPEYLYDSNADLSSSVAPPPIPASSSSRSGHNNTASNDDDPFGPPPTASNKHHAHATEASGAPSSQGSKTHKTTGSNSSDRYRHTIQVEYDEPRAHQSRRSEDREHRSRAPSQEPHVSHHAHSASQSSTAGTPSKERRSSASGGTSGGVKPLPTPPAVTVVQTTTTTTTNGSAPPSRDGSAAAASTSPSASRHAPADQSSSTPSKTRARSGSYSHPPTQGSAITVPSPPRGLPATPQISVNAASPPGSPPPPPIAKENGVDRSKDQKTGPSIDQIGHGKAPTTGSAKSDTQDSPDPSGRVPSESGRSDSSVRFSPAGSTYEPSEKDAEKEKEKDKKEGKEKTKRRNTLTVMVEPFLSVRGRGGKKSGSATPSSTHHEPTLVSAPVEKTISSRTADLPPTMPNKSDADTLPSFVGPAADNGPGMPASTSKAKKVMAWFRGRSKTKDVDDADSVNDSKEKVLPATPTPEAQSLEQPSVVVTTPTSSSTPRPPSLSTKIIPQRSPSSSTVEPPSSSGLVSRFRNTLTVGYSNQPSSSPKSSAPSHPYGAMRTHQGAVDQSNVTTKPPAEVIKHVKAVLEGVGVEIQVETEYKFRCIRHKRRKGSMIVGTTANHTAAGASQSSAGGSNSGSSPTLAAVTMVGSAASNGVDKRGLPLPSPSAFSGSGGMLRGLLMRRQSSQVSNGGGATTTYDEDPSITPEPSSGHDAIYGDSTQDAGDEVRFYVELTRIVGLNDTFSLDIRRLKGNLRSYKFLYESIRERVNLQR